MKNALASGLTAGATAGMGNVLGVGSTVAQGTKTLFTETAQTGLFAGKQVLNNWGSAVIGATSAASSVVANKLVGNRASFRWGDVAASAVASGLSSHTGQIGLDNSNPVSSIVNWGLRYGADKVFGNQASWNFGNVAVDAFGNAIGNSIVQGLASQPKANNKTTKSNQTSHDTSQSGITPNTTTGGVNTSQGAVNINPENALERWNRLEASGGLDSLSDDSYYSLATAANSIENVTRPITSFDRFNRLFNHSNMIRQQLNGDLATKAQSVQRTQSLIANNQAWIDRNTTTMGRVPQGFDLESSLIGSIDWTDMSQAYAPGPWREEYVFGPELNNVKNQSPFDSLSRTATGTGVGAAISTAIPGSFRVTNGYQGVVSPKYYASGWNGGSRAGITTYNVGKVANVLGDAALIAGTAIDAVGVRNYYFNSDPNSFKVHPAKASVNLGIGVFSAKYNPVFGIMYGTTELLYPGGAAQALSDSGTLAERNQAILGPNWRLHGTGGK